MRSGVTSSTGWPSWVGRNPALWCPEREVGKAPPLAPQLNHATAPDFVAIGRFKETVGAETYTGSYSYSNTGVNTGDVVLKYDDGDRCTIHVVFTSTTAGTANSTCTDGESLQPNWRLTQIPAGERAPLFEAIRGLLQL